MLPISDHFSWQIYQMVKQYFPNIKGNCRNVLWLGDRAIQIIKNVWLEVLNDLISSKIPGSERVFLADDSIKEAELNQLNYPVELLSSLPGTVSLSDHKLYLKDGYIVTLLQNFQLTNCHVYGARYIVEKMTDNFLFFKTATGTQKDKRLILLRIPCDPGDDEPPKPGLIQAQFPVLICFAITTNKSQGQSFSAMIGIGLYYDCFAHGQLYIAISRITHPSNISVFTTCKKMIP